LINLAIFAFYKDVTENPKEKSSNLKSTDRIKLAVKSYFELIFLFGITYLVIGIPVDNCETNRMLNIYESLTKSFGTITFTDVNFITPSNNIGIFIKNLFIVLEVIASMNLILFSLAKYIGSIDNSLNYLIFFKITQKIF